MTDLSPQAQAVAHAYDNTPEKQTGNHRYHWLAAALRAAADQVVPEEVHPQVYEYCCDYSSLRARMDVRASLLAIANELEPCND